MTEQQKKESSRIRSKKYREKHLERRKESDRIQSANYRKKYPEKVKDLQREWAQKNRDYINEQHTKWRRKNPHKDREYYVKRVYGITPEQIEQMLISQDGKCAICETALKDGKCGKAVDHNHNTGKVRQLLCFKCNMGLGRFNDNVYILEKAVEYLKKWKEQF